MVPAPRLESGVPVQKPMIAIDGYNLALEQGTGVATYARNLSFRLGALGAEVGVLYGQRVAKSADPVLREITFFDPRPPRPTGIGRFTSDVREVVEFMAGKTALEVPVTDRVIRTPLEARLPHFDRLWSIPDLWRGGAVTHAYTKRFGNVVLPQLPEVMHWTYQVPLRVKGAKNIYTLHDMVPLRMPYATLDHKRRQYRMLRTIADEAEHIVTVSETSKRDIMSVLGVAEEKITNTYQAVDIPRKFSGKPEDVARAEVEGNFRLPWKGYFLFFGAIEPKKNVNRLVESFLGSGVETPLVLCGRQAWDAERELALLYEDDVSERDKDGQLAGRALSRKLRDRVVLIDYAPFRLLVSLVRGAKAVLFPSLYEGFGLPVLEAMHLGTPVMTSNTSSLPEVAGDAALLVDPYDTSAMAEAIRALDTQPELRAELSARGPKRAALFDNAAYERRLVELYAKLGVRLGEPA
jgi:glycosyltransferase involved in cell wall biosynthesis